MILRYVSPKRQLGSFRQNARRPLALMLRSIAARRERRRFHSPNAPRCVSKDEDGHRVLQSSPYKQPFSFPRRFRRGTRWLVRSLYFPVFLQIRNLSSPVSRSQAHTPPRSRGAFLRPGFCIVASLTPNRGVGGAPRNVRVQRHPCGVPSCVKDARKRAFAAARQAPSEAPSEAPCIP